MQRAQASLFRVPGSDIRRISRSALHLDFDPIGSTQFKVPLNDGSREVVHFFEHLPFAIVEIRLPMPRRVSTRTCGAENKELRIGGPLHFLNVTSMLAIRRLEILRCQDGAAHVTNLDARFVEGRTGMSSNR